MAKENFGDIVVDKLHHRFDLVKKKLGEQFKNVKPFRQEPVDDKELYFHYKQLSPEDMGWLVQQHGQEVMNDFIFKMYKFEQDKRRKTNA